MNANEYDVLILGSGVAGSVLATVLSCQGKKVCVVEQGQHPRFAIGESTIVHTSYMLRLLALKYDVPEFLNLTSYNQLLKINTTSGVKRNFGFVYHSQGQSLREDHCLQSVIPDFPHGPEAHWFRQDIDQYLVHVAIQYGVTVKQATSIEQLEIADSVTATLPSGEVITAQYVFDCSGFQSPIAIKHALRPAVAPFETNSRVIFNHFLNVQPFDEVAPCTVARRWHQGTVHHLFKGGWFWVIPFNNTDKSTNMLCSIGLVLNRDVHPENDDLTAEEEFWSYAKQHPTILAHLQGAKPVRKWVGTGRMQYGCERTVGDRYCVLGHSAGFVDPLFSRGLGFTLEAIDLAVEQITLAFERSDFSEKSMQRLNDFQQQALKHNDDLVHGAYLSLNDYSLWNAYFRVWSVGNILSAMRVNRMISKYKETGEREYLNLAHDQQPRPGFIVPDMEPYHTLFDYSVEQIKKSVMGELPPAEANQSILSAIGDANLAPPFMKLDQPDLQVPAEYGLSTYVKIGKWVKKKAPKYIREEYFDISVLPIIKSFMNPGKITRDLTLSELPDK